LIDILSGQIISRVEKRFLCYFVLVFIFSKTFLFFSKKKKEIKRKNVQPIVKTY